jgi:hypothetical protein
MAGKCGLKLPSLGQDQAQITMKRRVARIESDGAFQERHGLIPTPCFMVQHAEHVKGRHMARLLAKCRAIRSLCLRASASLMMGDGLYEIGRLLGTR